MLKNLVISGLLVFSCSELLAQSVTVRGVRLSGSGCSESTATAIATPDGQYVSVLFDNYMADIGIGSQNPSMTAIKKNCRVMIDVDVPFGFQYAIERTEYRGFANLPASAYGYHRFTQVVTNGMAPSMREAQLRGPISSNYEVIVAQKPGRSPYSICNAPSQTIELLSELAVAYLPNSRDRQTAMINLDSVDTGINSRFKLTWRRCR